MKKLIVFMLACVHVAMLYAQTTDWTDENGITWEIREDEAGIFLAGASNYGESFVIPSKLKGQDIYYILPGSFNDCLALKGIADQPNIKRLDDVFSGCVNLVSVGNLSACTSIGNYAFFGCSSLSSVGDLSACTSIGSEAFYGCSSLSSVGDLSSCTSIGDGAFYDCSSLSSVGDLSSCTSIGDWAFHNCKSLNSLSINATTPPTLGSTSVFKCNNNGNYNSPITIRVPEEAVEAYRTASEWSEFAVQIIPNNVVTDYTGARKVTVTAQENGSGLQMAIGENNLGYVTNLEVEGTINGYDIFAMRNKMPNLHVLDLTNADIVANPFNYYASYHTGDNIMNGFEFYEQTKLTEVKLPKSVKNVGSRSFSECNALGKVTMHEGLDKIDDDAFEYTNLKDVIIPEGVTSIGSSAFKYCSGMNNVQFPSTLKTIGSSAFGSCYSLTSLELPDGLQRIEGSAFSGCSGIKEVIIPGATTYIGDYAFSGCPGIKTVKSKLVDPFTIGQNTFSTWTTTTLYVPMTEDWSATYNRYYWDTQWGQFAHIEGWNPTINDFYIDNDYDLEDGTIGAEGSNPDADMNNQAGFHVKNRGHQKFHHVHVKHNGSTSGSLIGDESNMEAEKLFSDINIASNRWYFFSFPFDVKVADITYVSNDNTPANYVFRYYDGKERAENGRGGWKNFKSETLEAGTGYIFQANKGGVLTLPVDNPDFTADGKSPKLDVHSAANAQDASWNFVGNPYLSYYMLEDIDFSAPITVWNGSGYEAVRPGDDDYVLQPYQAFFVQKPSAKDMVSFDKDSRTTYRKSKEKQSAAKARRAKAQVNRERMLVNIEVSDGVNADKTRIVFNDNQSMDYEMECDAAKFLSTENVPQIYSIHNNVSYAINERPNGSGEVQLGFVAKEDGTFTISPLRMDTPMLLKDAETGITADLSENGYVFSAKAGTYNKRFMLIKAEDATAIETIAVSDIPANAEIYDLAGRKLSSAKSGVNIVNGKKVMIKL
ncbi:MAG: leucine-rich repeat domain-containing protein [Prevotellaceae bacterium]|nr:leucine-rich repeat domain-containing protein [Candidatus Minthosoma caballi]